MTIGGIPVKIASNGRGMAVTIATNGKGIPATKVSGPLGVPIREVAKGGIPIVYVGQVDILAALSWTAGAVTNLSIGGGFARATATNMAVNNPRIFKGPFTITSGKTYRFGGKVYERTAATNCYVRVSTASDLSVGDVYQNIVGGSGLQLDLTGVTFTAGITGAVYLGIIPVVGADGEYSEIDNNFSLVML